MENKADIKPLTIYYAIKNKMTVYDCVRYFDPSLDDQYIEFILWEKTCYPFSMKTTIEQLNDYFLTNA